MSRASNAGVNTEQTENVVESNDEEAEAKEEANRNVLERAGFEAVMHAAAGLGFDSAVLLQLRYGARVDAITKNRYTALHGAAERGHYKVLVFCFCVTCILCHIN
ncbi:uncharacterized protein LOC136025865 [Artemia franciscana]|uniref:uncharacterized protein LOC136025865 n=1 Tax=Artemia franciscana TaxID=6661 RepID=UPI0032DA9B2D